MPEAPVSIARSTGQSSLAAQGLPERAAVVEQSLLVARAAEHVGGRESGQLGGGSVPVHDAPVAVDDVEPVRRLVENVRVEEPRERFAARPHWHPPHGS